MKIEILEEARQDLRVGFDFYEKLAAGLGSYFFDSLFSDIDSLQLYAGVHRLMYGSHRCLSRRFPFAIFYRIEGEVIRVRAVLDCRINPSRLRRRWQRP